MTIEEFRQLSAASGPPGPRPNKYGAKPTGGHASRKEHRRALQLRLLERAGRISGLREQVPYELIPAQYAPAQADEAPAQANCGPNEVRTKAKPKKPKPILLERPCRYVADFVYHDKEGRLVVEDTKGVRTKEYIIKRKLMLHVHGIRITEI